MPFRVTLSGVNITFTVEDGETVLDAALRQGIDIPYSCYSGICTTCKAKCISGQYDYGDFEIYGIDVNDNPENEVLLCSAFPKSDMVVSHPDLAADVKTDTKQAKKKQNVICDIVERTSLAKDVQRFMLQPQNKHTFAHRPGQYVLIEQAGKTYPFSIANNAYEDTIELHMLDASYSPAPAALKSALAQSQIAVQGPLGKAYLRENADNPIIFVAGGSGFAAVKPMIEQLFHSGSKREIILYWGVRHPDYLYLDKQVKLWQKTHKNFSYVPVVSGSCKSWQGRTGLVHAAVLEDYQDLAPYHIYLAGPFEMAFTARDSFVKKGAVKKQIFSDAFEFQDPAKA